MTRLPWSGRALQLTVIVLAAAGLAACQTMPPRSASQTPQRAQTAQPVPVPGIGSVPQSNAPPAIEPPVPVIEAKPPERELEQTPAPQLRPPAPDAVRIGLLLPLSGPNSAVGRALLDAAQVALFDFGEDWLTLLPRDTRGTPEGAADAARGVLAQGAQLIIGPLLAGEVAAVAPAARERAVPVLSFSTDRSVAGAGVWVLGYRPEEEVGRVVQFARGRGLGRIGVLAPDSPYGAVTTNALRRLAEGGGVELSRVEAYAPDLPDAAGVARRFADYDSRKAALAEQRRSLEGKEDDISKQALERLKGLKALSVPTMDSVFLPDGGQRLRSIATMLAYYELDPKKIRFLGTGLWDDPALGAEPALQGGWFASADPKGVDEFRKRFEQAYGRRPPRLASLAFDALALAAVLSRAGGLDPFTPARLTDPNGFAGYEGLFRLLPDGTNERGLAVLEVGARTFRVIDPAPTTFITPTN